MSRHQVKYLSATDWERVRATQGADAAGKPPPGARLPGVDDRWTEQLPIGPPLLDGPGPESHEAREARQRRLRVDQILEKLGLRQPPGW